MSDESKVLNFTTIKLIRDRKKVCQCENVSFEVDIENRVVTCAECGAYYDPLDAMMCIATQPEQMMKEFNDFIRWRNDALKKWRATQRRKPRRLLFRELEQQSFFQRGDRALPLCPHCNKPFYFEHLKTWISEKFFGRYAQISEPGGAEGKDRA